MAAKDVEFSSDTDQLIVDLHDRVATITMNRPDARNALSPELTGAFQRAIIWADQSDEVGALIVTGAGSAFCSGGDVKAMGRANGPQSTPPSTEKQFQDLVKRHRRLGGALYGLRKPTIAVLPGAAAGAGMAIALACDMRMASPKAFLSTGYARIGLSGDYGISWLLTRVVGPAKARQLMLTSERVPAEAALQIGLLNEVLDEHKLHEASISLATKLANGPAAAIAYIKDNLDEALSIDHATAIEREADRLLKARSTNDHREAVRAFAEKREPNFTGT